jgi:hypothetical protein
MAVFGHRAGGPPRREARDRGPDAAGDEPSDRDERPPEFRYGAVFGLILALVVFLLVAPTANWSRAVALALEGAALVVAVGTARARPAVRRRRARAGAMAAALVVVAVGVGAVPAAVDFVLAGALAVAIPLALAGGLLRLVRDRGVTFQVVAGTLAIYLLVGVLFAWAIGFVADVADTPYYAQGTSGSQGQRLYFSFTVLTTTGFGDLTAATAVGRTLAVLEMLVGQLYVVTVIGLVVGNFVGRGRRSAEGPG